jgi:hypothetical protein
MLPDTTVEKASGTRKRGTMSRGIQFLCFTSLVLVVSSIAHGQEKTFSMPGSVLLFGNYEQGLVLRTPESVSTLHAPENSNRSVPVAVASLGSEGERVAWGFPVSNEYGQEKRVRCAVGVYSVRDHSWQTYGDFSRVMIAVVSPDDSMVAFVAMQGSGANVRHAIFILDLRTGKTRELSQEAPSSLSWSPDRKSLAMDSAIVSVVDNGLADRRVYGERHFPAWSPSGEWIAYIDASEQQIRLVRPDGTEDHLLKDVKNHLFGHRHFALSPVWSPDSTKILLNEYKGDGDSLDVVLLDIKTGHSSTKLTNGNPVLGWAVQHKRE